MLDFSSLLLIDDHPFFPPKISSFLALWIFLEGGRVTMGGGQLPAPENGLHRGVHHTGMVYDFVRKILFKHVEIYIVYNFVSP